MVGLARARRFYRASERNQHGFQQSIRHERLAGIAKSSIHRTIERFHIDLHEWRAVARD